jgi:hypothetical protein
MISFEAAHKHCTAHRAEVEKSDVCGCFYCLSTFAPSEIQEWVDDGRTALCPKCEIDAVLADKSGFPVTDQTSLTAMHKHWFERTVNVSA